MERFGRRRKDGRYKIKSRRGLEKERSNLNRTNREMTEKKDGQDFFKEVKFDIDEGIRTRRRREIKKMIEGEKKKKG